MRRPWAGLPLVITGVLMGGGPVSWAVVAHHRAGLAHPRGAVRVDLNDDLDAVQADLGIEIDRRRRGEFASLARDSPTRTSSFGILTTRRSIGHSVRSV